MQYFFRSSKENTEQKNELIIQLLYYEQSRLLIGQKSVA